MISSYFFSSRRYDMTAFTARGSHREVLTILFPFEYLWFTWSRLLLCEVNASAYKSGPESLLVPSFATCNSSTIVNPSDTNCADLFVMTLNWLNTVALIAIQYSSFAHSLSLMRDNWVRRAFSMASTASVAALATETWTRVPHSWVKIAACFRICSMNRVDHRYRPKNMEQWLSMAVRMLVKYASWTSSWVFPCRSLMRSSNCNAPKLVRSKSNPNGRPARVLSGRPAADCNPGSPRWISITSSTMPWMCCCYKFQKSEISSIFWNFVMSE